MQLNIELLILMRQPSKSSAQLLLTVLKKQKLSYHHYAISDVVFDELRRMLETQYLYPRTSRQWKSQRSTQ
jgi:hypothetical protein